MKHRVPGAIRCFCFVALLSCFPHFLYSEGTKEVRPSITTYGNLSVSSSYTPFATYGCQPNYRLQIRISNVGEKILFGFHIAPGYTVRNYQLRNPSGTIVLSGPVPTSGTGYIANYNQAVTGPFPAFGGYTPIIYSVTSATEIGDFYIEFSGNIDFDLFDFTVVSGANTPALPSDARPGRLWSQAWQFYAAINTEPFSAKMYVYSDDGIVTRCDYSNAQVGRFTMFCNSVGCTNTGNFTNDRKSKNTNTSITFPGIAQYKVFCNNPDTLAYPNGVYGVMIGTPILIPDPSYPLCSGKKLVVVEVNKAGNVEIRIDVPYGGPEKDVYLYANVTTGVNNIPWDGLDGTGIPVPDGTQLIITVTYVNGLTNLPLWDIEENPDGFTVTLVRPINPAIQNPMVYWDDTEITLTGMCPAYPIGSNLTGCVPSGTGCHIWNMGDCHDKMINTWWYSASSSTAQLSMMHIATPPLPVGNDVSRCGSGSVTLTVTVLPNETVDWYDQPTGGTLLLQGNTTFVTPLLTSTTVYYAEARNDTSGCLSTSRKAISAIIHPIPDPPGGITSVSRCGPGTVTFTATAGAQQFVDWYDAPTGGNKVGSGLTFTTPSLTVTTSYYAQATSTTTNCVSATRTQFTAVILTIPSITNTVLTFTICSQTATDIALTSSVPGSSFSWTATNTAGSVSGFSNGTGSIITQTLTNNLFTNGQVTYAVTPNNQGCPGTPVNFVVTVYPKPNLSNNPAAKSICSNSPTGITLTSNVTGTQFTWTAVPGSGNVTGWANQATPTTTLNQTLVNTGFTNETVTYQITPTANGCAGDVTNFVVTVFPVPDLSNTPLSKWQCNNMATGITLTSNVTGTQFTWTCIPGSGWVTGWANQATPTTLLNQTLVNSGSVNEWVTYQVTPTANGCPGQVTSYVVTVFPTATLTNFPPSKQQCNNTNTNITLTSNVAGAQFTWTALPGSGNITGWASNSIPTTLLDQALVNSGYSNEWVTYQVTPTANGCTGTPVNYQVIVYPTPDLSNTPPASQVCNNTPAGVTLVSNVTGSTFTWTCTPSSGNVTGWSANATPTALLNQTLVNLGLNIETVTYHMTPSANGCTGPVTNYILTVVQSPDVFFNPNGQTICSGTTSSISVQSSVPGTTFTWTALASSPNLSGYASGSGDLIAQTVTNSGTTIEGITYQVTPTAYGCPPGATQPVVLTVNPTPVITNPVTTSQICSSATTAIVPQSPVPGSTFSWTASGSSANVTGFSNGAGLSILQSLINSGFSVETVTYQVIPTANGCSGNPVDFTVTVFPVAEVYFVPNGQAICSGQATNLSVQSHVAGATFTWTAVGSTPQVTGYSNGSGNLIQQILTNSGYLLPYVTYQVIPTANGCTGTSGNVMVTVNPAPVVSFTYCFDTITTTGARPFVLTGGSPLNGTYSGSGIGANMFYPGIAGPGTHQITYSYTNTYGCSGSVSNSITIANQASHSCGNILTDIRDNNSYPTVQIGAQCWMAANLNFGNTIASSQMQRDNCISEKYCTNDNPANCVTYGGLYQWSEVMRYSEEPGAQGFCPAGWHLPTETDWNTLFNQFISSGFAGNPLKYTGYSGFNAFPSGMRFHGVIWKFPVSDPVLSAVMFWSSSVHGTQKAWAHGMNQVKADLEYTPSVSRYPSLRSNAFAIRCIKD